MAEAALNRDRGPTRLRRLGAAAGNIELSGGVAITNADLAISAVDDIDQEAFGSMTVAWFEPE